MSDKKFLSKSKSMFRISQTSFLARRRRVQANSSAKAKVSPATFAGIVSTVALQIVLKVELNLEEMLTVHYNLQAA